MNQNVPIFLPGKSYALILSKTWGKGILNFKGKKYRIKAKALGAGYAIGSKKIAIQATVYNLLRLEDIAGNYYGVKAGATLGKGRYVVNVKNNKGVTLGLVSQSKGPAIDLGAGLATFSIKIISMRPVN